MGPKVTAAAPARAAIHTSRRAAGFVTAVSGSRNAMGQVVMDVPKSVRVRFGSVPCMLMLGLSMQSASQLSGSHVQKTEGGGFPDLRLTTSLLPSNQ